MPKPKPDEVIRHEVVLGSVEREALKDIRTAYTLNRVLTPLTNLSPSGMVVLGGSVVVLVDYLLTRMGIDPNYWEIVENMTPDQVHDWLETQNLVGGGIGALLGVLLGGGLAGGVVGGVVGSAAVEAGEEVVQSESYGALASAFISFRQQFGFHR